MHKRHLVRLIALAVALTLFLLLLLALVFCVLIRKRRRKRLLATSPPAGAVRRRPSASLNDLLRLRRCSLPKDWPSKVQMIRRAASALMDLHEGSSARRLAVGPTPADDVHAFGVLVLEVACGRRDRVVDWAWGAAEGGGDVVAAVDAAPGGVDVEEARRVVRLGMWCTCSEAAVRPTMRHVVMVLDGKRLPEIAGLRGDAGVRPIELLCLGSPDEDDGSADVT